MIDKYIKKYENYLYNSQKKSNLENNQKNNPYQSKG